MSSSLSSSTPSRNGSNGISRELGRTTKRQRLGYSRSIGTVNQLLELCQSLTDTRIPVIASPLKTGTSSSSSSSPSPLLTSSSPSVGPMSSSIPGTPSSAATPGWDGPVIAVNDVARVVLGIARVAKQMADAKTSLTREFKDMYTDITRFGKTIDKSMYSNVDASSSDVFDNRQMNIVMLQQLLRDGRFSVAHTFIKEAGLSEADVPVRAREQFQEVHTIVAALRARDPQAAIDWVAKQSLSLPSLSNDTTIALSLHALSFSLHRLSFLMLLLPSSLYPPSAPLQPSSTSSSSSPYNTPPHAAAATTSSSSVSLAMRSMASPSLLASPAAATATLAGSSASSLSHASGSGSGSSGVIASPMLLPSTPLLGSSSLSSSSSPPLSPLPSPLVMSSSMSPFLSPLMLPSMPSIHHMSSSASGIPSFSLSSTGNTSTWPRAISFGPSSMAAVSPSSSSVSSPSRPILAGINSRAASSGGVSITPISLTSSGTTKDKDNSPNRALSSLGASSSLVGPSIMTSNCDTMADRMARTRAAMTYAQRYFAPFATTHAADIGRLMACLMFTSDLLHSPYADLLQRFVSHTPITSSKGAAITPSSSSSLMVGISLWKEVELQFTTYFYRSMGLPSQSPLITALHASDEALPKSLKFHALMVDNANNRGLVNHAHASNASQLVDIELGKHLQYHSTFVCPIVKTQCSDDNPPVLLRCGHVISRDAVDKLTKTMRSNRFKCPTCPREQTAAETLTLTF